MIINPKTVRPEVKYYGPFSEAFRRDAHTLIYWGYKGALSRIKNDSHPETDITGYIAEAINNRLRAFDCPVWCEDFTVKENPPVQRDGCEGRRRPMPDLIIEGTITGRPEYIFEAKRLKKTDFGIDKYLGSDGLGCFINGKYASRYDEAAMLGYIQSDFPTYWLTGIQERIEQMKPGLSLTSLRQRVEIIAELPDEWLSEHAREGIERPIFVYHILLDFRPNG